MLSAIQEIGVTNIDHSAKTEAVVMKDNTQQQQKNVAVKGQTSEEQIKSAVKDLNIALKSLNVKREFEVNKDIDRVVVTLMDSEKKEVIRQIPSEEAVKLSKNIREMIGLLFDSKS